MPKRKKKKAHVTKTGAKKSHPKKTKQVKKHAQVFKRHKIKDPEDNPIEELIEIYEESDAIDEVEQQLSEQEVEEKDSKDFSLKHLIENTRSSKRKKTFLWTILIFILLAVSAVAGISIFGPKENYDNNIKIEISGPEEIMIGEPFEYTIKYRNLGEIELTDTRLFVNYPNGFILDNAIPEPVQHRWNLGTLKTNNNGEIKITGKIVDDIQKEQKIVASINFYPANFNSEFINKTDLTTILKSPELEINTEFPANVTLGQKTNFEIKIKNKGDADFNDAKIAIAYPNDFTVDSVSPTSYKDNKEWLIEKIEKLTEEKFITIEGFFSKELSFTDEASRNQDFTVLFLLKGPEGDYYLAKEEVFTMKIIDQSINTYIIINGTTDNKNIEVGQNLAFSVIAKNTGEQTYEDVTIKTILNSTPFDIFDWPQISDDSFGKLNKTDAGKEISWGSDQIEELKIFKPGEEITIEFQLPIKEHDDLQGVDKESLSKSLIKVYSEVTLDGSDKSVPPVRSSEIEMKLNSNIELNVKALYYLKDGTPIGSGPIPPEVGESTKMNIFWDFSNSIHDLEDLTISTTLPENITWTGETNFSVGSLTYDLNTRTILWNIDNLSKDLTELHANFGVSFIPAEDDKGKVIKLTSNTIVSTRDKTTKDLIIKTKNIITSALELDEHAKGQGVVSPF